MIAYIRALSVEKKRWLDAKTFADGVALCQMIPGATAMQASAYVGLKARGVLGAGATFLGFGLPAFFLMLALSATYNYAQSLPVVVSTFSGLQAIVVAIMANATLTFGKISLRDWKSFLIAGVAAALFAASVSPIAVIGLAALGGLLLVTPKQPGAQPPVASAEINGNAKPILAIVGFGVIGLLVLALFRESLFQLAALMLRIDLLAFGGGFASVPIMLHEIVEVRGWMDSQTFMNGIVLGQVTPGPIVITATFIGYQLGGLLGGVVATISIFLPSFLLVIGISPIFDRLRSLPAFNKAIGGVLCSFVGLILTVTIRFALDTSWDLLHILLASASLVALLRKVDILWVVLVGAAISAVMLR